MDARELINTIENWSKDNLETHRSIAVLRDADKKQSYIHYAGENKDMANMLISLMEEDREIATGLLIGALIWAKRNMEETEFLNLQGLVNTIVSQKINQNLGLN